MDLAHLTIEELEQKRGGLDPAKQPHEALELSNEIGRRKAGTEVFPNHDASALKAAQHAPRLLFLSLVVFLVICHVEPPVTRMIVIIAVWAAFHAISSIYVRSRFRVVYDIAGAIIPWVITGLLDLSTIQTIQYVALFYSVFYGVVFLFKDRIKSAVEESRSKAPPKS